MIRIELTSEAKAVIARMAALPEKARGAIASTLRDQDLLTVTHIVRNKLSQRGPDTLGVVTNRLRGSVRSTVPVVSSGSIESGIGTNVRYAAAHEFGTGPYLITARRAKALYFTGRDGTMRFARTVRHPGHKARHMFRAGVEDRKDDYSKAISERIIATATKGDA